MCYVSFIIPVYNLKEEELENCVSSVANQTIDRTRYEIIIVDDGSNNGIEKLCDSLGERFGATVIHQPNQGLAVARNTGMKASHGEWIVHVDGDDWIGNDLVESLMDKADKDTDIVVWGYVIKNGNKRQELLLKDKTAFDDEFSKIREKVLCFILDYDSSFSALALNTSWGKAYRREFIEQNGLYYNASLRRAQDAVYNLYAFDKVKHIGYIDKALSYYRADNISLSRGFNPKTFDYLQLTAQAVDGFVSGKESSLELKVAAAAFVQRCFRMINVQFYQHKDNKDSYWRRRKAFLNGFQTEPFRRAFEVKPSRQGLMNRITDFLYRHRLFGCIALFNQMINLASSARRRFL